MSTTTKKSKVTPPPLAATRHEDDLYTWVQEQVALLRAGKLSDIDAANVAEELSDVGKSEYHRLQSAIAVLTQHLLKWEHQPSRRSRSWALTVRTQRRHVEHVLADNPGLKSRIDEAMSKGYQDGRDAAVGETDLDENIFPAACPYPFDAMMTRSIEFQPPVKKRKRPS